MLLPTALLNRLPGPRNLLNRQYLPSKFQQRPGHPHHREIRRVYEWAEIVEIDDAELLIIVTRVSSALSHAPVSRFTLS